MSLISFWAKTLRRYPRPAPADVPAGDAPAAPIAPSGGEPPVQADALLDLALVMRELWWGETDFATHGRSLAAAALARAFPHYVTTVERCECWGGGTDERACSECPTEADMVALDTALTRWLRDHPRPSVVPPMTDVLRAFVPPSAIRTTPASGHYA